MRMPRFRLRTMMAVLAVVAIPFGVCAERRARFLSIADRHFDEISDVVFAGYQGADGEWIYEATSDRQNEGDPPLSSREQSIATWYRHLAWKYQDAAAQPWLPVAPDPPEPK